MDMSHPFQLFISAPPLWIFEPWEHADALLTAILLIQPNSINFKKEYSIAPGFVKGEWEKKAYWRPYIH